MLNILDDFIIAKALYTFFLMCNAFSHAIITVLYAVVKEIFLCSAGYCF
jgi:hypothetical protein